MGFTLTNDQLQDIVKQSGDMVKLANVAKNSIEKPREPDFLDKIERILTHVNGIMSSPVIKPYIEKQLASKISGQVFANPTSIASSSQQQQPIDSEVLYMQIHDALVKVRDIFGELTMSDLIEKLEQNKEIVKAGLASGVLNVAGTGTSEKSTNEKSDRNTKSKK